ncbi:hypothetical protein DSLASN_27270 [Desulfoluna limicola]|uniref:ATP-grasp domain-containing protein n=2 Tax=Desulfoluna limicola TaxID=2810562 RepID=A0ABM7PIV5_9BACT|nr:hypothetical protein DSLASN_27270 [Desulfoluna limicola]
MESSIKASDIIKQHGVHVVITGADHPTGLFTARSLVGCVSHITGITMNRNAPCCRSRVWNRLVVVDTISETLTELLSLGVASQTQSVLFAAQDIVIKMISDNREALAPYYRFVLPDREVVNTLIDKGKFYDWAVTKGFSVPASSIVSNRKELNEVLGRGKYPMIIKPVVKNEVWDRKSSASKVYKIYSQSAYDCLSVDLLDLSPELLLQQWIPGGDEDVWFCLVYMGRDGEVKGSYTGRKLLQWPIGQGNTAAAVGEKNETVAELTGSIFRSVGFYGLGSLEFKRNVQDGKYYIIEPTVGRNDYQSGIALAGGLNLTAMASADAAGICWHIDSKHKHVTWIDGEGALRSLWGGATIRETRAIFFATLCSHPIAWSLLKANDPFPFIAWVKKRVAYIIRNFGTILLRRIWIYRG